MLSAFLFWCFSAAAQQAPANEPLRALPCLGYHAAAASGGLRAWGRVGACGAGSVPYCQSGAAFLEIDDGTDADSLCGSCCLLPLGVLTEEHVFVSGECPADSVVTGVEPAARPGGPVSYRCTRIDAKRYRLGPTMPGVYYGYGRSALGEWGERTVRSRMPVGLRYGLGRIRRERWDEDGCIGFPMGSILVGGDAASCTRTSFSRLEFRGAPGDPAPGTPVPVYPECSGITDILDGAGQCLP